MKGNEGDVHKEEEDNQYSDKGLYSANQLSPTKLGKETTDNEQVTDLPNDFYGQNLYWADMHQRGYSDSDFSCNQNKPTVDDENIVWKNIPKSTEILQQTGVNEMQ
ncbi:hypothetical protein MAR_012272 [Mya arenaria]|uniref:Uncharacterized protein n=1 Tax=Mya arenaria TaxID=6604 RepID=A0ABY7FWI4_MYAAR|nr:hypothetical protein MAR_012272 [Mya arenaria]